MQEILLSFALIILAGVLFRRLHIGIVDADTVRESINSIVLNLFLPALCVKIMHAASIGREALLIPATAWITTIGTLLIGLAVYRLPAFRKRLIPRETGVLVLSSAFGNVTYLGLPVLTGLYGAGAAKYALFYDLLATTPVLWLVGTAVVSRYGSRGAMGVHDSLKAIVSLPPIWGISLGIALNLLGLPLPGFMIRGLDLLGGLVVPLMIFSIGLALSLPKVTHAFSIIPAVAIKMAISPALSCGTGWLLGLRGEPLAACLIEGAMPTMVLSLLIAALFGLDVSLAAFTIVVTTALSFVSLPLAAYLAAFLTQ